MFLKIPKLCCIFRRQCYVAEDCVNPPDDLVINVCVAVRASQKQLPVIKQRLLSMQ